jgi:caffeoyl-CoA O-methyltransferase
MSFVPADIENYCIAHSTQGSPLAKELMEYTQASVHGSHMLIGEMEGSVLKVLIKLGGIRRILELGTYTGYSALSMAEALPANGELITVDINPETSKIARSFWDRSPHGHKITQILKPGPEALASLDGEFDLVFIDADKNNYPHYLEWSLRHLSARGIIITDNTLWYGKVLAPAIDDKQTASILKHNQLAAGLEGFTKSLLPIRDGMFLIQKG